MTHRVLIVDDDPAQRRLLDSMIRRCGHDTVLADSGGSALDLLAQPRTRPVDLIVLDLVMPGMDGLEMLSRLDTTRRPHPRHRPDRARLDRDGRQGDARRRR